MPSLTGRCRDVDRHTNRTPPPVSVAAANRFRGTLVDEAERLRLEEAAYGRGGGAVIIDALLVGIFVVEEDVSADAQV
jgi:hypothetical protein